MRPLRWTAYTLVLLAVSVSAKSKPAKKADPPPAPIDRVIVYTTPEADLLKPKFKSGLESAVTQTMQDPSRFFSVSDAVKVGRIVDSNKEPDLLIRIVDVAVKSYKVKKADHLYEVENEFSETISDILTPNEVTPYLTRTVAKRERVVRVGFFIAAPGKMEKQSKK